jgi:BirA family biotin operon repressor/biotin-[acetyl-CoA-carboxylase] ligase
MTKLSHHHFNSIDSTQNYAKAHAKEFDREGVTVITADEQTAGRGRFQRRWISPKGVNLYATFYFQIPVGSLHLTALGHVMTASLAQVLLDEGLAPKIKWPNDLLLNGKKVSGVLCETAFGPKNVAIFLGIGVNVNMERSELAQIDQPATSLQAEKGHYWDREKLQKKLESRFLQNLALFKNEGFAPFYNFFENLLAFKGEKIRCFDGKKTWEGVCHSLTFDGQLNIYLSNGTMQAISAGDII